MGNSQGQLPGNPTVGQVASAEQRQAMIDEIVDRLIAKGVAAHTGNGLADWITGALRVADAVQESSRDDAVEVAVAIAAEAIRRISDLGVRNGRRRGAGDTNA